MHDAKNWAPLQQTIVVWQTAERLWPEDAGRVVSAQFVVTRSSYEPPSQRQHGNDTATALRDVRSWLQWAIAQSEACTYKRPVEKWNEWFHATDREFVLELFFFIVWLVEITVEWSRLFVENRIRKSTVCMQNSTRGGFFLERVGNFLHVERNWTCSSATVYLLRVDFFQTVGTRSVQVYGKSNVFNIWNRSRLHNYRTKSDGLQRLQVAILKIFMSIVSF